MDTDVTIADICLTGAGTLELLDGFTCKVQQLTLADGARLVFDFTSTEPDQVLLKYTGGAIEQQGTTLLQLVVHDNWNKDPNLHRVLATGLATLGDVEIIVTPADAENVTYLGRAFLENGMLCYVAMPEPATATLSLLALAALAACRRRK